MPEISQENTDKKLTRREFLKWGSRTALTTAAAVAMKPQVELEVNLAIKGEFETKDAIFHPFYERHDQHEQVFSPENIPTYLDVISLEGIFKNWSIGENGKGVEQGPLQMKASALLLRKATGMDTFPRSQFWTVTPQTLEHLKTNKIDIASGDIGYDEATFKFQLEIRQIESVRENMGKILYSLGAAGITSGQLAKSVGLDRRGFVRTIGIFLTGIGLATNLPVTQREALHENTMDAIRQKSGERLWARITTISHNLRPEEFNDLFRELIQANKLILLAKNTQSKNGDKPKIGYSWHYRHRGIEDWLIAGEDVIRAAILAFPKEVLQKIIESNQNDPRCLYAIRSIEVPKGIKIIDSPPGTSEGVYYSTEDPNEKVKDRIYEDLVLKEMLTEARVLGTKGG